MATITHTVLVDDTYRYSSDWGPAYDWANVLKYYQDTGANRYNVYGKSGGTWNASCIPIPAFDFKGKGNSITLKMYCYYPEEHTYRYALCTSMANKSKYEETLDAVSDSYQIKSGTFKPTKGSGNNSEIVLTITADIPANTPLYLYIWAYEKSNYAAHILRDSNYSYCVSVTLDYTSGLVHIDNGSKYEDYQVYIDNGSGWDLYIPYIDNGSSWDILV